MTFWAMLLALAWDRLSPLVRPNQFERLSSRFADWTGEHFNAGTRAHGLLAWAVAALLPALALMAAGRLLTGISVWLGLAWGAAVLYYCLGFRQVAEMAKAVADALRRDETQRARDRLQAWGVPSEDLESGDLARLTMVEVFAQSLGRLFGVLFWFLLLGPFGAVAYALTRLLAVRWQGDTDFDAAVEQLVAVLDWLPIRLMVFSFALVGDFEGTVAAWRAAPASLGGADEQTLLAAGFGALGMPPAAKDAPGIEYVGGAVSLVARTALLWLGVIGLFWLGGL